MVELLEARCADDAFEIRKWSRGFRKILLLTGSSVYAHKSTLHLLADIAAGRYLVPMHEATLTTNY